MSAWFSDCRTYRWRLQREFSQRGDFMAVCMLNGSKADEMTNDPTIVRVCNFAARDGFGGIDVMNAYGLAATDSKELKRHIDPIGPANDDFLHRMAMEYDYITVGWGALSKFPDPLRALEVCEILTRYGAKLLCWGTNADGTPKHPLYLRADTPRVEYPHAAR